MDDLEPCASAVAELLFACPTLRILVVRDVTALPQLHAVADITDDYTREEIVALREGLDVVVAMLGDPVSTLTMFPRGTLNYYTDMPQRLTSNAVLGSTTKDLGGMLEFHGCLTTCSLTFSACSTKREVAICRALLDWDRGAGSQKYQQIMKGLLARLPSTPRVMPMHITFSVPPMFSELHKTRSEDGTRAVRRSSPSPGALLEPIFGFQFSPANLKHPSGLWHYAIHKYVAIIHVKITSELHQDGDVDELVRYILSETDVQLLTFMIEVAGDSPTPSCGRLLRGLFSNPAEQTCVKFSDIGDDMEALWCSVMRSSPGKIQNLELVLPTAPAGLAWVVFALFHRSSSAHVTNLNVCITFDEYAELWDNARNVLASTRPGQVLVAMKDDASQLKNTDFPECGCAATLSTTSFQLQRWLGRMERAGARELTVEYAGDPTFECLAISPTHVAVLVPGFGFGWVARGIVTAINTADKLVSADTAIPSCGVDAVEVSLVEGRSLRHFLEAIGSMVKSLTVGYGVGRLMKNQFGAVFSCCRNVQHVRTTARLVTPLVRMYGLGMVPATSLTVNVDNSTQCLRVLVSALVNPRHLMNQNVRELCLIIAATGHHGYEISVVRRLCELLRCNTSRLRVVQVDWFPLRKNKEVARKVLEALEPLTMASRAMLALVSVVLSGTSPGHLRLDHSCLHLVAKFVGSGRRVNIDYIDVHNGNGYEE